MLHLKLGLAFIIFCFTLLSGYAPLSKKYKQAHARESQQDTPSSTTIAAGIFLGAGLMHMLPDAAQLTIGLHFHYPIPFCIAGLTFLLLLLLEHMTREVYPKKARGHHYFSLLAVLMLSVHSFFTGMALGFTGSMSIFIMMLFAIFAHKWAESFALAVQLNNSSLSFYWRWLYFLFFSFSLPLGIGLGLNISQLVTNNTLLIQSILLSISAGTFLYLGTLHGLERATLLTQCCNLKKFLWVLFGFAIMAFVAYWL